MIASKIKLSDVGECRSRLDGSYHLSEAQIVKKRILSSPYPLLNLGNVTERIWHAGRWKRVYVDNPKTGITLLGSSAMLKGDLSHEKLISKKYTDDIPDKFLQAGWILISCSGTIGNCAFTNAQHAGKLASQHVIRLKPNNILGAGLIYAYLASKYGYVMLTQGTSGSVIQHIEPENVEVIPIPNFPDSFKSEINQLIQDSSKLRDEAMYELEVADKLLKEKAGLRTLTPEDYDYFGQHSATRKPSCFARKVSEFGAVTFNAFNNSERIKAIISSIPKGHLTIKDVIEGGETFSSTGAPSIEVKPHCGIMLINQKDIFDTIITGKYISRRGVKTDNLVKYGEVLIASDGTLGENETFCRAVYANEDLEGAFLSSHFIRMRVNDKVPSGYLYCWLNSDYGFRLIRRTQAGTKICHPINKLFLSIPVPILADKDMKEIDRMVRDAHTKRHHANVKELKAIAMVEAEIEKWN